MDATTQDQLEVRQSNLFKVLLTLGNLLEGAVTFTGKWLTVRIDTCIELSLRWAGLSFSKVTQNEIWQVRGNGRRQGFELA